MRKRVKQDPWLLWTNTPEGHAKYQEIRAKAQAQANELGFDFGIERNDLFKTYRCFMLPNRENRFGFELLCEVVSPEKGARRGHGPVGGDK